MQTLLCQLIILFFIFSIVGWMIEVTLKYFQYHRFINRGFMIGPYCPDLRQRCCGDYGLRRRTCRFGRLDRGHVSRRVLHLRRT